jgi:hypothetical protein
VSPCRYKLAFRTHEQAERTAAVVAALRPGASAPVRTYECPHCGALHYTSSPQRIDSASDSTVAALGPVAPLWVEQLAAPKRVPPAPPPPVNPCAKCGAGDARFSFRGSVYHRKCRTDAILSLPTPEERRAALNELAAAGQEARLARVMAANLARTGPTTPSDSGGSARAAGEGA